MQSRGPGVSSNDGEPAMRFYKPPCYKNCFYNFITMNKRQKQQIFALPGRHKPQICASGNFAKKGLPEKPGNLLYKTLFNCIKMPVVFIQQIEQVTCNQPQRCFIINLPRCDNMLFSIYRDSKRHH